MIFATKDHKKIMKKVLEKILPLFDFMEHTTLNKLLVIKNLFEELDENCKFNNLTLNQNLVKSFFAHIHTHPVTHFG